MSIDGAACTRADVAWLIGMSDSWVRDRMQAGDMPRPGLLANEYVAAFVAYRTAKFTETNGLNYEVERARLTAEQADREAMKNATSRGELLVRADVTTAVRAAFSRVRAKLLAVPSRAAPLITAMSNATAVQEKLTDFVYEALHELSITIVTADDLPDADGGDGGGLVGGDDAPAETDGQPVGGREPPAKPRGKRRTR